MLDLEEAERIGVQEHEHGMGRNRLSLQIVEPCQRLVTRDLPGFHVDDRLIRRPVALVTDTEETTN